MLGHVATVPTVAPTLATMIGLGVGIDYALFIVTRHFRGMHDGLALDESIARAAATSGGAVFFAGGTVTIALVSLAVAGIPLVTTMGLMAAIAVVVAVLGALTLLPAVLAIVGPHINSLRVRHPRPESKAHEGLWAKWAHEIAQLAVGRRARRARDPDSADDPTAVAHARPAGQRRAVDVDDRAQGVRPALEELRPRHQRAAARSPSRSARRRRRRRSRAPRADRSPRRAARSHRRAATRAPATRACRRCRRTSRDRRRRRGHADPDRQAGTTAYFNAISTKGPAEDGDDRARRKAARERDPERREGHRHEGRRRRQHRRLHRPRVADLRTSSRCRSSS